MTSTVEQEIEAYEKRTGIKLDAHNRATFRAKAERENKHWEWEARDYVYGQDEGEPPKGAQW